MKRRGSRLTFEERKKIEELVKTGLSATKIAEQIERGKTSVFTEIKTYGRENYSAIKAQEAADLRLRLSKYPWEVKSYRPPSHTQIYKKFEAIEMQIEILHETIKELNKIIRK